jgi:hypothetical protein
MTFHLRSDSFKWIKVIDKFQMKPDNAVGSKMPSANDRYDAEIVPLTLHPQERAVIYIKRRENGRSADAQILCHTNFTRNHFAVLIEHFD